MDELPDRAHKGRGAVGNPDGRFERQTRVAADDGWGSACDPDLPPLRTTLTVDTSRTVLARNESPDVPFDRSLNPYRGCEHGCIYCFARPSHAYLGLSPGLDFETRLFHKPDAPALLERELRAKGYRPQTIALGANTDPYQPVERRLGLTRRILEVLDRFEHPVGIVTKSDLVLRDIDLLSGMAARRLVHVCVSVTTLDRDLARRMEPRAPTPARRLDAIRRLAGAGVPVAVLVSPVVPGLTDHEMETILEAAADAGARGANTILIRLPRELGPLFDAWLHEHAPERAERVLSLIRDCRGGALYESGFGRRMTGRGAYAAMLSRRFALACRRLGLGERWGGLDTGRFRPPPAPGDQLSLF
nr:PA0069 family radical SAM protein [Azospirillum halopraeferens]